jgi:hypothetical protein
MSLILSPRLLGPIPKDTERYRLPEALPTRVSTARGRACYGEPAFYRLCCSAGGWPRRWRQSAEFVTEADSVFCLWLTPAACSVKVTSFVLNSLRAQIQLAT